MKERPIIFSTDMVRAILDGRKTQTRRILKYAPIPEPARFIKWSSNEYAPQSNSGKMFLERSWRPRKCPYGQVGDRLWVRETFALDEDDQVVVFYRATDHETCGPWKPSIFMPRWASRIDLQITKIKVDRVQDINEEDAITEGCLNTNDPSSGVDWCQGFARACFCNLWDSINAKRGYGWDVNPWVWVIEFNNEFT